MDPYNSADVLAPARPAAPATPSHAGVQPGAPLPSAWLSEEGAAGAARTGGSNPYSAPSARLEDLRGHDEMVQASRLSRLGAQLIDNVGLVAVPAMLAAIALPAYSDYVKRAKGLATTSASPGLSTGGTVMLVLVMALVVGLAIFQLVLLHRSGQTIGKRLVGIRIVRSDGSRAGLARIFFLRMLVPGILGAIPLVGPFISLIGILMIFGSEQRCMHDHIADTVVVDA